MFSMIFDEKREKNSSQSLRSLNPSTVAALPGSFREYLVPTGCALREAGDRGDHKAAEHEEQICERRGRREHRGHVEQSRLTDRRMDGWID